MFVVYRKQICKVEIIGLDPNSLFEYRYPYIYFSILFTIRHMLYCTKKNTYVVTNTGKYLIRCINICKYKWKKINRYIKIYFKNI